MCVPHIYKNNVSFVNNIKWCERLRTNSMQFITFNMFYYYYYYYVFFFKTILTRKQHIWGNNNSLLSCKLFPLRVVGI